MAPFEGLLPESQILRIPYASRPLPVYLHTDGRSYTASWYTMATKVFPGQNAEEINSDWEDRVLKGRNRLFLFVDEKGYTATPCHDNGTMYTLNIAAVFLEADGRISTKLWEGGTELPRT